ncbi:subtilisin-like protein [Aulographum hederae CBS 113979]|uniref:tripeptidyl-peptidase II n=1 Tax=Aulographum hederae CBS 113979 TaxID=1176131 RepID=A0A6G1H1I5_9PEZI|nr:subtilisin-like protein [Aulographum hederae CBS 113979]
MFRSTFAVAALALQLQLALAGKLHESIAQAPSGWTEVGQPAADTPFDLQIALKLENTEALETHLVEVASPGSQCYGNHMSKAEVEALIKPKDEVKKAVVGWLQERGIQEIKSDDFWVTVKTTIGKANEILETTFATYEKDGIRKIRTTAYSLPETFSDYIDLVTPTTFFSSMKPQAPYTRDAQVPSGTNAESPCQTSVTPACLKEFYNIGDYKADPKSGSIVAFGSFLNQTARYNDLFLYEKANGIPEQNFTKVFVNNAPDNQEIGNTESDFGEANLDVQCIVGVANPLPVVEFLTAGSPPFLPNLDMPTPADNSNEPYIPYLQYLLSKENADLPQVITNSYGEPEQTVPETYARRACLMFGMLAARGITVFESSGDTGVGSHCQSNDGKKATRFLGQFPSTCPWLTGVGGTEAAFPEVAWEASSGGFSDYWTVPEYQKASVDSYFTDKISPAALEARLPYFSRQGRGFPDVSAHSLAPNYQIWAEDSPGPSGGASAASPVWAAVVGLLNDARLRAGMPALGFLNPWLYSEGYKSLIDVTGGGSIGCTGENLQTGQSFNGEGNVLPSTVASWNATAGWDPVTGLGMPDFQKMKAAVLALKPANGTCARPMRR